MVELTVVNIFSLEENRMKMLRLTALAMAMLMLVFVFASCNKSENDGKDTSATDIGSLETATFSSIVNPAEATLKNVATSMKDVPELDGFSNKVEVNIWKEGKYEKAPLDNNKEFIIFSKRARDTDKLTYKIFSIRSAKVILGFTDTAELTHEFFFNNETPAFIVKATNITVEEGNVIRNETDTMYDASGATVPASVGTEALEAKMLYDKIVLNRNIYEISVEGKLSPIAVLEGGALPNMENSQYDGNKFYVGTNDGFAIYDSKLNYIAEWFKPANTKDFRFFALNDGNVLIQYQKTLAPDATEYDMYEGDTAETMVKYDLVTEIFNVSSKASANVDFNNYIAFAQSNASLKTEKSIGNNKDDTALVGDFENYAIIYPIQEKKVNLNEGAKLILLMGNDAKMTKSIKLVENQTGIPEKYTEELYKVPTTYGYAITDVAGKVVKQVSGEDLVTRVGDYLVDSVGIYSLNYESVLNFNATNSVQIGIVDNTVFVKKYASADTKGDYTVYAYSKGEPKELCKYSKENAETSPEFVLYEDLCMYAIYNRETKLCSYYNADGTSEGFMKDSEILLDVKNSIGGSIIFYMGEFVTELGSSRVLKYVAVSGNFYD